MGREAECELLAQKLQLPGLDNQGNRRYSFSKWNVLQAPRDLPDGNYTITTADGCVIPTAKQAGIWFVGDEQALLDKRPA